MLKTWRTSRPAHATGRAGGFTLLEVTVVVVILALLATIVVPRLTGNQKRTFRLATEQVADLLLMYAQRDSISRKPVGIRHELYGPDHNWILLVTLEASDDPLLEGASEWKPDRAVAPVKLPLFGREPLPVEFRADGELMNVQDWPLASTPGRDRPTIDITLYGPDGLTATVSLASHAVAPDVYGLDDRQAYHPEPIDLDAIGHSREDW
ncbi:MAG: prepilin-type N-terminal cleavage/methylation domain-containing protein [Phycisphaerales bacterium]|nr:MAG: prepilin-type N-terminal cleavage/methylation domain-containing protein [Phycisphaerales bacterium]